MGTARSHWVSFPEAQMHCCHLAPARTTGTARAVTAGRCGAAKAAKAAFQRQVSSRALQGLSACPREGFPCCLLGAGGGEGKAEDEKQQSAVVLARLQVT